MLTDVFSLPQLLTMLSRAHLSDNEIEYRILEQVAHREESFLKRKQRSQIETSVVIPYNGATISFVIIILAVFGLSSIKFCRSRDKVKLCKIKISGVNITEPELLAIVHKIELVFHMARFSKNYSTSSLQMLNLSLPAQVSDPWSEQHTLKESKLLAAMQQLH